jgi:hypothetical protein
MKFRIQFVLLLICLSAGMGQAQTSPVLAGLAGTVEDTSGAVIVGAEVVLTAGDGKKVAQEITDKSGNFRFANVAKGTYTVDVTQSGFREVKQQVKVTGTHPPIRIVLPIASVNQEVTVAGNDTSAQISTEIAENQNANTIDRDALDNLPVFDQDYIATMSRFLSSDATGTSGIALVVNGIEANGPGVTASAIQSVKINQNPYTALYSRPGRARIEIETKGGTPQFHGTGNFLFRNSIFDAQNAFAVTKPSEQRTFYEGSLTGPLSHNRKTTFLLAFDQDSDNQEAIVVAAGPDGPINENVPNPTSHYFISGRVFHTFSENNQFWIGYSYEHQTVENKGVGGTVLPEAGANTLFFEHEINVGHTYVFSPKLLNQLHFLVGHFDNQTKSLNENPQVIVSGAFIGGGAQADARRTEYHFDGTDIVTYTAGKQVIKFGVDIPDISRRGFDDFTNQAGTYSFASLESYDAATPFSYLVQSGNGHVTFLETTFAGIFEDNIRLKPNFSIAAGVRYYWQNYFHSIPYDFAPRLSFAYAPAAKGTTVIRGGAGFFFDRTGPGPISNLLLFNGVQLKRFILENPSYPVTAPVLSGVPTSVVVLDPRQRMPYTLQYGVGIEQQVNAKSTLSVGYVGSRGIDLFRSLDVNAPPPPGYITRPNPNLGQERQMQSEGYQKSNALEISFRGRPTSYLTSQAQYTLGKTYNNTSGINYFPANSYFPTSDWARSDNDRRNKFDMLGALEAGKWFHLGAALGLYSGKPVNETTGNDENHDSLPIDRPSGVPRNTIHGPSYLNLDVNLAHDIFLTKAGKEGVVATISINSFNVLNHPNDVTYIGVVGSPFFGQAVAALPPRQMQLNLKIKF